jgi:D-inositol-3-phosphate glycosyltransferase
VAELTVALLSRHTSPLAQPGGGNAGGMNTYVLRSAYALARLGVQVEMATAVTREADAGVVEVADGVRLHRLPTRSLRAGQRTDRHVLEDFGRQVLDDLPRCDVIHGHYWQSGIAGLVAAAAWDVPLAQSAHTLARVKNSALAPGQHPESTARIEAEATLAERADLLIANTSRESDELVRLYHAAPERVRVIEPGVDTEVFTPQEPAGTGRDDERRQLRADLGLRSDAVVVAFVGRLQKLKAPDVLLRLAAPLRALLEAHPAADRIALVVCGAPAGSDLGELDRLRTLAAELPPQVAVRFVPPRPPRELAALYRAVDVVVVPSRSESFGLVALEAQACGTPVVAAHVGGLPRAVGEGTAGLLVRGQDPARWAAAVATVLTDTAERRRLELAGPEHAAGFTWDRTADDLLAAYRQLVADGEPARVQPSASAARSALASNRLT